jgi:hypothetical protein
MKPLTKLAQKNCIYLFNFANKIHTKSYNTIFFKDGISKRNSETLKIKVKTFFKCFESSETLVQPSAVACGDGIVSLHYNFVCFGLYSSSFFKSC